MKVFNCIMGIFSLFAAFYCFAYPGVSALMTVGWIVTVLLGVIGFCGIFESVRGVEGKKNLTNSIIALILAIAAAVMSIVGMVDVSLRATFDLVIVVMFALFIIAAGIDSIINCVKQKKSSEKTWWVTMIWGILLIIMGLYASTHLIYATMTLGYLMGFALCTYGIRLICSVFEK